MNKKFQIKKLHAGEMPFTNFKNPSSLNRYTNTQKPIVDKIVDSNKQFVMLSAPPGLGKSLICSMAAYQLGDKINYVCSDKSLQDQLLNDFPEGVILKGRNNYKCNLFPHLNADTCVAQCQEYALEEITCDYYDTKEKLLKSNFRILNTFYLLYELNFSGQLSGQELIIIDEADTLDLNFTSFISLQVYDAQINKYGLGYPKLTVLESWIDWAGNAIDKLESSYNTSIFKNALDPEFIKANKLIQKLKLFITLVEDDWIYNRHSTYSEFKPIWISNKLIKKYLLRHSNRFILCSASLPPKPTICNTLAIESTKCDYIEVGSSFKPENRKVFYSPVMDMSYKNRDDYHVMIDAIEELINSPAYRNVKGIIHSQSYALRDLIMEMGDPRLITHDSHDKYDQLEKYFHSKEPLIFVSPSSVRGLSLNDDKCRFGICPKMPFPNLKDKAISARLYGSGNKGRVWYNCETAQILFQMSGRHVRSHSDWGDFHILDSCFDRIRKHLPEWFNKDIIEDFDYGEDDDEVVVKRAETKQIEFVTAKEALSDSLASADDFDY